MKIATQLVSAAPDNNMKAASAEDSGTGFQNVLADASGTAAKSPAAQAPTGKDAVNPRTSDTKKKDPADQAAAPKDPGATVPLPLTMVPAVLPAADGAVAQKAAPEAQGASIAGQFAATAGTETSLAALGAGPGTEATAKDAVAARSNETPGTKVDQAPAQAAGAVQGFISADSKGPLPALPSAPAAESAAADAARTKSGQSDGPAAGPRSPQPETSSNSKPTVDEAAASAAQSIAASVQSPAMGAGDPLSGNQFLTRQVQAAGSVPALKSVEGGPAAGSIKGTTGAAAKGKTVGDELRGKKSDVSDGSQTAGGSPFAAKVLDAMPVGPRNAGGSQSAIDAAGLQQAVQASGHMGGLAPGQTAGQASAGADAKAALETAAQAAAGAQGASGANAMPGVSSAHLVQSANSSEMRLGMQSAEFGNISISTSLNHQSLSAQISIDHSELGKALAAHLPAIEEKLGTAYGVQAKVELRDSNNPSQSGDTGYSNSGQQSKEQRQSEAGAGQAGAGQTSGVQGVSAAGLSQATVLTRMSALTSSTVSGTASRLDIRI